MMRAVRRRGEETAARVAAGRARGWSWRVERVERERASSSGVSADTSGYCSVISTIRE